MVVVVRTKKGFESASPVCPGSSRTDNYLGCLTREKNRRHFRSSLSTLPLTAWKTFSINFLQRATEKRTRESSRTCGSFLAILRVFSLVRMTNVGLISPTLINFNHSFILSVSSRTSVFKEDIRGQITIKDNRCRNTISLKIYLIIINYLLHLSKIENATEILNKIKH